MGRGWIAAVGSLGVAFVVIPTIVGTRIRRRRRADVPGPASAPPPARIVGPAADGNGNGNGNRASALAEQLRRLSRQREAGEISEEEFRLARARLIDRFFGL